MRVYPPSWALSTDGSAAQSEPISSDQVSTLQAEPEVTVPVVGVQDRDELFSKEMPESPTLEHVVHYVVSFFQSQERAVEWLSNHCPALASAPVKLMDTPKGRQQVITILYGSYHSVYQQKRFSHFMQGISAYKRPDCPSRLVHRLQQKLPMNCICNTLRP